MRTYLNLLPSSACQMAFSLIATATVAFSAPLSSSTAAHTKPDENSPVVTVLNAGTAPTVAT
ncbi:MAG: hypothetical protein ABIV50_07215, partial [Opitutus sp.]